VLFFLKEKEMVLKIMIVLYIGYHIHHVNNMLCASLPIYLTECFRNSHLEALAEAGQEEEEEEPWALMGPLRGSAQLRSLKPARPRPLQTP
jgi:hypothetical protein